MKRKTLRVDAVLDIETEDWTTFVVGGLWTERGFEHFHYSREEEYVDRLLAFRGDIWAHNGGRFDALWLLQHISQRGLSAQVGCAGQRIVNLQCGKMRLRDSYALVPMSLAKCSPIGGYLKSETGLACQCGEDCGGYCRIKRGMCARDYAALVLYLEDDCRATAEMLKALVTYADVHDLDLCSTVGASAYATARRRTGVGDAEWCGVRGAGRQYRFVRKGYFGGRTQVFAPQAASGERYDINSAYPAALASLSLPTGGAQDVTGRAAGKAYAAGRPGVFSAVVRVPECFLPPLPVRGQSRISYPTGQIAGVWCSDELAYAERCGARVESIDEGVSWPAREMVFAEFCRYVWSLRDTARAQAVQGKMRPTEKERQIALAAWLKWFANSLTGKLAQRPEVESVRLNPEWKKTFCPADVDCRGVHPPPGCCAHECTGACGGWSHLAGTVYTQTGYRIAECAHIQHAAFLTAQTRVTLHEQLVADEVGGLSAVYCDTDSVIATKPRTWKVGEQLGQFKHEGGFRDFQAIAPKTYRYINTETGKSVARSKGIPDAGRHFDDLLRGEKVSVTRGVGTFRSAARSGGSLFARKLLARGVHADGVWFGDLSLGEDGRTWPVDAKEMRP